jgi:hypothetical protein
MKVLKNKCQPQSWPFCIGLKTIPPQKSIFTCPLKPKEKEFPDFEHAPK